MTVHLHSNTVFMKIKPFAFFLLYCIICLDAAAQNDPGYFRNQQLINGYTKALQGETISYFSVYPQYIKDALLTRCTDGNKVIEWQTDTIPADLKGDYAFFTWVAAHADGTSSGIRNYDLYINDVLVLTMTTYPNKYPASWSFATNDSTRILFEYKTNDGAMDAHGMMYLRVPLSKYAKGRSLKMKLVGQNQDSNDWFMTFKYSFKEKMDAKLLPFVLRGGQNNTQPLRITILHFGLPATAVVSVGKTKKQFDVRNGFNVFEMPVKTVSAKTNLDIHGVIANALSDDIKLVQKPIVYREIDLIHNAHTDIGYSHIQEDVIKIHNDNISAAIKLIAKTKDYPEGSKFIWHVESSWAVENFLKVADANEKKLFIDAVKKGQIVISGTYANVLTGLSTPEEMNWITAYSCKLRDSLGLPVKTAMMSDIPGMSWSMVDALAKQGIRYFSNGPNYVDNFPDKGDRIGHTLRDQGNKAFWWKSASGKDSILFWTCGKGYSAWHGFAQGSVMERGPDKIADYMDELDSTNYPYDMVHWRYNIVADNGVTDSSISDFVKDWNEKYISPKLVLANATDMFERFEKKYGKTIPVLSGDFTPYWEDGAYSTAAEEGENRMLSEKIILLEQFAKQKMLDINQDWLYRAKRNIVLFHEHTWGAWCSITKPDDPFSVHQWNYKKGFVDSAKYFTDLIEASLFKASTNPTQVNVVNTLPWSRSGVVEIDLPGNSSVNSVVDENGKSVPVQRTANGKFCFVAGNIPANGQKLFKLSNSISTATNQFNALYDLTTNPNTGAINSLKTCGLQWVNNKDFSGLMQVLYVAGLDPSKFTTSMVKKTELVEDGPVLKRIHITCSMSGSNEVSYEISQYSGLDFLLVTTIIDKKAVREKESVHIAFPFAIDNAVVRIGVGDGFISPDERQIAGSNKDFFSVQRWIDVSGNDRGVTVSSPQAALFEVGELVNEERVLSGYKKWKDNANSSSTIFLYALNNYWHTNYKADQQGPIRFDCYLGFHKNFDKTQADHFGYESTQPLVGMLQ